MNNELEVHGLKVKFRIKGYDTDKETLGEPKENSEGNKEYLDQKNLGDPQG